MSAPTFTRDEIRVEIERVLKNAKTGRGSTPGQLTSYQILDRLPDAIRDHLLTLRGEPGRGSGNYHSAATHVADIADTIAGVEVDHIDNGGITFDVAGQPVTAGYPVSKTWRLVSG